MNDLQAMQYKPAHLLSLLVLLVAAFRLSDLALVVGSIDALAVYAVLAGLVLITAMLQPPARNGDWLGFPFAAALAVWSGYGLGTTLLTIVAVYVLVFAMRRYDPLEQQYGVMSLDDAAIHISLLGLYFLILHLIYTGFGTGLPLLDLRAWPVILGLVFGGVFAYIVAQLVGVWLTKRDVHTHLADIERTLFTDGVYATLALVLPLTLQEVGPGVFLILAAIIVWQAILRYDAQRTQTRLFNRLEQVSTLNHIGATIADNPSLDVVLESVYQEVVRLVNMTTFLIALYDENYDLVSYAYVHHNGEKVSWPARMLEDSLTDRVIRERKTLLYRKTDNAFHEVKPNHPTAAYLGLPLIVGERIIGVMSVVHAQDSNAFNDTDVKLLEAIASQAGLVLRNAALYQQTSDVALRLSVINESLQDVMFNLDQEDAMHTACQVAIRILQADKAAIYVQTHALGQRAEKLQSIGFDDLDLPQIIPYDPLHQDRDHLMYFDAMRSSHDRIRSQAEAGFYRACIEIPLRSGSAINGFLGVYHDTVHYHSKTEIDLLTMLSSQVIAALDNADLLHALEQYAAEQAQLVALSRISSYDLDLTRIINAVCETLIQVISVDWIEIALYQPETDQLIRYKPATDGADLADTVPLSVQAIPELGFITAGKLLRPFRVYYRGPGGAHSPELGAWMMELGIQTLILVPMLINKEVTGLLMLASETMRDLNDSEQRLLEMANHQISTQVHNARIHKMTEQQLVSRLSELDLIEKSSQQMTQATSVRTIIESLLQAAMQAVGAEFASVGLRAYAQDTTVNVVWFERIQGDIIRQEGTKSVENGLMGQVFQSGEVCFVPDNQQNAQYDDSFNEVGGPRRAYHSSLLIPLKRGNTTFGVLNLESIFYNFFTKEHARFLHSLVGHAVTSIDNVRYLREREQRIDTLTELRSLALETANAFDREDVIQMVLAKTLNLLGGWQAVLFSVQQEDSAVVRATHIHPQREHRMLHELAQTIPPALLASLLTDRQPLFLDDVRGHDAFGDHVAYRSLVLFPMQRRGRVMEVIAVTFRHLRHFNDQTREMVDLLAVQAASNLENASLNQTLRMANTRMRAILDATRDAIVLLAPDGTIQDINNSAATMMYLGAGVDHTIDDLLRDAQTIAGLDALIADYRTNPGGLQETEYQLGDLDDPTYVKALVSHIGNNEANINGDLLVLRDITEEKELAVYREKIQSMVLHDLRSPLAAVISSMYHAQDVFDNPSTAWQDQVALQRIIQTTLDSTRHLLHLVETLRDLPNIAKMPIQPAVFLVRDLAEEAQDAIASNLRDANIEVVFDIAEDAQLVYADDDLLRRVFINLLHNAYKFTPENGQILIQSRIEPEHSDYCRILVCDTGPGIPPDKREIIFREFEQIKEQRPRAGGKGSGLGLNFCKLAIEAHGGRIWVQDEGPLSGACFAFTVPHTEITLQQPHSDPMVSASSAPDPSLKK